MLAPFQAAVFAIHPDLQRVLFTRRDLRGYKYSAGSIVEPEQGSTIIVQ